MYNFGQFRSTQYTKYLTDISFNLSTVQKESELNDDIFTDYIANVDLPQVDEQGRQQSYYLKFSVNKIDSEQTILLKLVNGEKTQNIKIIKIAAGQVSDAVVFETIINPNDNYNQIYFELVRTADDYNIKNGRVISLNINKLASIYNIINFLNSSIDNKGKLKQIGVQGFPGLLMSINGEEIRVGRTGIYELNFGATISSLGFVIESNDKTFLLDYQY